MEKYDSARQATDDNIIIVHMLCVYTGRCMCATLEYNFVLTYIFSYCISEMLVLIDLHWV